MILGKIGSYFACLKRGDLLEWTGIASQINVRIGE